LCKLVAQSSLHAEGRLQAGGGKGVDRAGHYKSQSPVVERAIETAALMLGSDKSRGYCLEMICADFLAGANLGQRKSGNPALFDDEILQFLPGEQRQTFLEGVRKESL